METVIDIGIERKFAEVIGQFSASSDPFELIKQFRDISSSKALQVRDESIESEEFDSWSLETKLWHLVQELYSYRLADIELDTEVSTDLEKELNYRNKNKKLTELFIIRNWIQYNSEEVDVSGIPMSSKWRKTKMAIESNDLNVLQSDNSMNYLSELDADAPLRTGKTIHKDDSAVDSEVFKVLYKLVLYDRCEDAITIANETGNYSVSLILIGHIRHYLEAADIKHKLMWYQTVYELSQQTGLNKYEKLIYNYLSGSNISENLNQTNNYDEWLLLYCNQIIVAETIKFYQQLYPEESVGIVIPKPQINTIELILNALSRGDSVISDDSKHPIRIVAGGVMIKHVLSLITETVKKDSKIAENVSMVRILVHLSIFINLIEGELIDTTDFTKLLKLYIHKLSQLQLNDLVPIYVSFIPDEKEAIECYSNLLIAITEKQQKIQQIQICEKYSYFTSPVNNSVVEDRLSVILKKTVEKILKTSEGHYKPELHITIKDDVSAIDEIDKQLYQCVDWLVAHSMYEDIMVVSMVIIKRFLIVGKLAALKAFASEKDFKMIINKYDSDLSTRHMISDKLTSPVPAISDEERDELLNYDLLTKGLNHVDEWRKFIADNGKDKSSFKGGVEHSINKSAGKITEVIMKCFVNSSNPFLKEFRKLYIPYFIIELLKIYEFSRFNNVEYLNRSFDLIKLVANEDENDLLDCFIKSGKLPEFLKQSGQIALIASENGLESVFG